MKKITTLFLLLVNFMCVFAQEINDDLIQTWFGTGNQKAYLLIDFNDGTSNESLVWGFRFNESDTPTVHQMLQTLASEQDCFSIDVTSGFLNFIFFDDKGDDSGSDWWKTWSGSSYSNLSMNAGIGSRVTNGYIYGFSYGFMCGEICDSSPDFPSPANSCSNLSLNNVLDAQVRIYPNPVLDIAHISIPENITISSLVIYDINGRFIKQSTNQNKIDIDSLKSGVYLLKLTTTSGTITQKIIKK